MVKPKPSWERDSIQFPRLLAEIWAMGLGLAERSHLCLEMDITPPELDELFERADRRWQEIKDQTGPGRRYSA